MGNFKRNKPRRQVRCKMCTARGSMGNAKQRGDHDRGRYLDGKRLPERDEKREQNEDR